MPGIPGSPGVLRTAAREVLRQSCVLACVLVDAESGLTLDAETAERARLETEAVAAAQAEVMRASGVLSRVVRGTPTEIVIRQGTAALHVLRGLPDPYGPGLVLAVLVAPPERNLRKVRRALDRIDPAALVPPRPHSSPAAGSGPPPDPGSPGIHSPGIHSSGPVPRVPAPVTPPAQERAPVPPPDPGRFRAFAASPQPFGSPRPVLPAPAALAAPPGHPGDGRRTVPGRAGGQPPRELAARPVDAGAPPLPRRVPAAAATGGLAPRPAALPEPPRPVDWFAPAVPGEPPPPRRVVIEQEEHEEADPYRVAHAVPRRRE
ncbi:hypothetical protein GCM10009836_09950 [Pseudonocardia ailaonensis]|uniref:Roadblock/LAMTOR2 domain-containing protein n=1 Tax=Pseudonocardia ailaonensis TaxID=367279 RepID=A0ABN2MQ01_9PSEU